MCTVEAIQGDGGVVLDGVATSDVDGSTSISGELSSGLGDPEASAAADASAALTVSSFLEAALRRSVLLMVTNSRSLSITWNTGRCVRSRADGKSQVRQCFVFFS